MSRKYVEKKVVNKEAKLIPLGDIHLGDSCCDLKLFEGTLEYIKKCKNCLVVGMGDYLNCATKSSVSDSYVSRKPPQQEYEEMLEYLTPIKDKLVGLLMGNHEQRIQRESGVNLVKTMCAELGIPYLGWGFFMKVKVGTHQDHRKNKNYVFYATHGSSGSWTPEGKIRSVRRLSESFDADVYLMGHVHDVAVQSDERFFVDKRRRFVARKKTYYVLTGHFMNYQDSYAEMKAMKPSKKGVPKIKLFGDRWDVHVSV